MADMKELSIKLNNYLAYKKRWQSEAIDFPRISNFIMEDELLILAESQSEEIKELRAAIEAVDELWQGEEGFRKEMLACGQLNLDSPVYIVWKKIKAALKKEAVNERD